MPATVIKGAGHRRHRRAGRRRRHRRRRSHRRGRRRPRRRPHARRRGLRRRPRPRRPAHPPAPARPGGGRDDRDRRPGRGPRRLHLRPRHAQHHPGDRPRRHRARGARARARSAPCDVRTSGAITVGRAGEQLAPLAEMAELGVRFFTDDGAGVADARLMRRALEYAAGLRSTAQGVVLAQHCEDPVALRGRAHARGGVVVPARHPRPAGRGRGADGHARPRAGPAHRRAGCTSSTCPRPVGRRWCAPRRRRAAGDLRGDHRTTSRSPTPSARPTTRSSRSTRRCAPTTTSRRCGPAWPTARSTASPPTTRRTRRRPRSARSTRRRPACSASRRRSRSRSPSSTCPSREVLALLSWRPAAIARRQRRPRRPSRSAGRANLVVIDPDHTWTVDPAALRQPQPQHALRRARAAGQGAPHDPPRRTRRDRGRPSDERCLTA